MRLATAEEAVWHHYYNMGGSASALGMPISRFEAGSESRYRLKGLLRHFEHGAIYWTVEHGPCEVYGAGYNDYQALGGPDGSLGYPIARPQNIGGLVSQQFEGGSLSWQPNPQ
jgi:uncharacterized protein with LGFP repeats